MTAVLKFYKDLERYGLFKNSQFILNIPIELLNELVDKHQRNLSEKLTSSQTEISDEEIKKWAKEYTCKEYDRLIFDYENYDTYNDFINGAKKYREQLKLK